MVTSSAGKLYILYGVHTGIYIDPVFYDCDRLYHRNTYRGRRRKPEKDFAFNEHPCQRKHTGCFQILQFLCREPELCIPRYPLIKDHPPDRVVFSYFSGDELHHRSIPGKPEGGAAFWYLCPLCHVLSSAGGRTDRTPPKCIAS